MINHQNSGVAYFQRNQCLLLELASTSPKIIGRSPSLVKGVYIYISLSLHMGMDQNPFFPYILAIFGSYKPNMLGSLEPSRRSASCVRSSLRCSWPSSRHRGRGGSPESGAARGPRPRSKGPGLDPGQCLHLGMNINGSDA